MAAAPMRVSNFRLVNGIIWGTFPLRVIAKHELRLWVGYAKRLADHTSIVQ